MKYSQIYGDLSPRPLIGAAKRENEKFLNRLYAKLGLSGGGGSGRLIRPVAVLQLYASLVISLSLVAEFASLSPSNGGDFYLVRKDNVLNRYFVKWSWAWTCLLLGPLGVVSSPGVKQLLHFTLRLAVNSLTWRLTVYYWFNALHRDFSTCSLVGKSLYTNDERDCGVKGGRWRSFELSGHVYTLTLIALITAEELLYTNVKALYTGAEKPLYTGADKPLYTSTKPLYTSTEPLYTSTPAADKNASSTKNGSYEENEGGGSKLEWSKFLGLKNKLFSHGGVKKLLIVLNLSINLMWLFLTAVTSLYYHTFEQKALAFGVAAVQWLILYRVYKLLSIWF